MKFAGSTTIQLKKIGLGASVPRSHHFQMNAISIVKAMRKVVRNIKFQIANIQKFPLCIKSRRNTWNHNVRVLFFLQNLIHLITVKFADVNPSKFLKEIQNVSYIDESVQPCSSKSAIEVQKEEKMSTRLEQANGPPKAQEESHLIEVKIWI